MAQTFNSGLIRVSSYYTRLLKLKITDSSLRKDLPENPYYPSLLSLSETFDRYHVPNGAYEVPAESLDQLSPPFVAFIALPGVGGDFVVVTEMTKEEVSYVYENGRQIRSKRAEFLARYKNVVWVAEPNEQSGEADYAVKVKKERSKALGRGLLAGLAILTGILLVLANLPAGQALAYLTIAAIKTAGLTIGVLLLIYETDHSNAFVRSICNAVGHTGCDAVLTSKAAKIGPLSWSEVGFFYFASTTIFLLWPAMPFSEKAAWIAIANLFAAPYILFSLYYQWRVAKAWCALCLCTQLILAAELGWSLAFFWPGHAFSFQPYPTLLILLIALLLPIAGWLLLKPVLLRAKEHDRYVHAYKRLQYNTEIFGGLLQQQDKAPDGWQSLGIGIGNPQAQNVILKVCNPYCGPCAKAHPLLEELVHQNPNVQARIIFTTTPDEKDRALPVVRHLLALSSRGDSHFTKHALDDWYLAPMKDYTIFSRKYPMNGELKEQDGKVGAMHAWCKAAEITHTPTIYVNGYRLPENYTLEELQYILR